MSEQVLTPAVDSVTLAVADTQYSWTIPANCSQFSFQARTAVDVRFAFTAGIVAVPTGDDYGTLKSGGTYDTPPGALLTPGTIYFASDGTDVVVEIVYYQRTA